MDIYGSKNYSKGKVLNELSKIGDSDQTGTQTYFKPDTEIFDEIVFDFEVLSQRLRELAFLNKGIYIKLVDKRDEKEEVFHYEGGIKSFVSYLNRNKVPLHEEPIYIEGVKDNISVEVAIQY